MSPTVTAPLKASRLLSAGALTLSAAPAAAGVAPSGRTIRPQAPQPGMPGTRRAAADPRARLAHPPTSPPSTASPASIARARARPPSAACRWCPAIGSAPRAAASSSPSPTARRSISIATPRSSSADPLACASRAAASTCASRRPSTPPNRVTIDGPGAWIDFQDDGEYRIAVGGTDAVEVELVVLRGQAALSSEGGNVLVPQSHRSVARDGAAPSAPEWTNAGQTTLERWAADREAMWQSGQYASRQYLPAELADYAATFDQHGTWQNDETYGAVWYPSSTAEDWRPYYDGRWDYTSSYGWTWIAGGDAWAYPTHHYGRWNLGARGWHWIPSRRWGAAWVYWAVAPGYVGWCPLGWNGRPVLSVFHYDRSYPSRWRDPYRAWTVIPRTSFGRAHVPGVHADRGRLVREQPAFVLQHRSPGFAPPRSPYPSPFNPRLNAGTGGTDRAPARGGVSTIEPAQLRPLRQRPRQPRRPRRAARHRVGGWHDLRVAVRAGAALHAAAGCPRDRRRGQRLPPGARRSVARCAHPTAAGAIDGDRDGDRDDDGRGGAGYAGPGYRVRDSPGMSRPAERDRSPGMSDSNAGSRRAVPRSDPPARGDDDGDGGTPRRRLPRQRAGPRRLVTRRRGGGDRSGGGDRGGSRGGDSAAATAAAAQRRRCRPPASVMAAPSCVSMSAVGRFLRRFAIALLFVLAAASGHGRRRARRLHQRPAADLGARRLRAEHDHARLLRRRRGRRRVRDPAPHRHLLRPDPAGAAAGDHGRRGRRVRHAHGPQHHAHHRDAGQGSASKASAPAPAR